jgi:hypothetical protein
MPKRMIYLDADTDLLWSETFTEQNASLWVKQRLLEEKTADPDMIKRKIASFEEQKTNLEEEIKKLNKKLMETKDKEVITAKRVKLGIDPSQLRVLRKTLQENYGFDPDTSEVLAMEYLGMDDRPTLNDFVAEKAVIEV